MNRETAEANLILKIVSGSYAYGTATEESDIDYRGIIIPPKSYFLGLDTFNQYESKDPDVVYYNIKKFLQLALKGNPNILELVFADKYEVLTEYGQRLIDLREHFLTKRCATTYHGYAVSQMKRLRNSTAPASRAEHRMKLIEEYGYDCYSEDTEFLTDTGWKSFDSITNEDRLATFHPVTHCIEYQDPLERFDSIYNGNMYHFRGHHIDTFVTPNHKMYVREYSRTTGKEGSWGLQEAARMFETFDSLRVIKPKINRQKFPEEVSIPKSLSVKNYLRIMGWYISDGTCGFYKDGSVKSIMISQSKPQSRLTQTLSKLRTLGKIKCGAHIYPPTGMAQYPERRWIFPKDVSTMLYNDCGHKKKRIPNWVFSLTRSEMLVLLTALRQGDGTIKRHKVKNNTYIYYTKYSSLADDIQRLAFLCGYETAKWGPYEYEDSGCPMYQVYIDPKPQMCRRQMRCNVVTRVPVNKQRIVCFMVKNGTLVTRRNGKVGLHGNCKFASHMIRLCRTGIEVLREGKLRVYRPDAAELLEIRNGKYTLEEVLEYGEQLLVELQEAEKASVLPGEPDYNFINRKMVEIVEDYLSD